MKASSHVPRTGSPPSSRKNARSILFFLAQRLLFSAMVLLFIIFASYLGTDMAAGTGLAPAAERAFSKTLAYASRLLRGDLGQTTAGSDTWAPRPVVEVIVERLPRSLGLLGISLCFSAVAGILLGIFSARGRSRRSLSVILLTLIGVSVPSFFAAFLLQWAVTALTRRTGRAILPVGGFGWDNHLLLPALVLSARPIAQITRITFIAVREVLAQDYVRTAQGKGLSRTRVMAVHVLRNAAIPILTTVGVSLRFCLSSLPVVEYYFSWPGVGFTLLKGIAQQDGNLTVALALCLGLLFLAVNLILELSYRLIDPRLLNTSARVALGERQTPWAAARSAWDALRALVVDNAFVHWLKRFGDREKGEPAFQRPALPPASSAENETPDRSVRTGLATFKGILIYDVPLIVGGLLILGLIVVVFLGPRLAPNSPYHTQGLTMVDGQLTTPPFAPGEDYPWGTDVLGRGMMSLVLAGAQQTLILAVLAVVARTVVGVLLGALAGWAQGGVLDRLIVSLSEVIAAFPTLLLAMILILGLGIRKGLAPFVITLCFVGWGEIMQFVRSQVVAIRPRPYIESAIAVGAQTPRIIFRHVLPHLFSALTSIVSLEMGSVLTLLGELGFLSIFIGGGIVAAPMPGRQILYSDVPEWGALLSDLRYQARSYPWTA
ncbi:MAG: ABC transporter permease subunit, partial [Anaerolineae bacterium]|nr:ABC transporter permease subunit [Anaerolineae bacterium]